jgi:hypothetical protein
MNWLDRWRMRRSARRFATRLPGYLRRNWGGSDNYTEAQIARTLQHFRLGGRFVAVAYAGLLSEADYLAMAGRLPRVLPYDLAREVFERARPWSRGAWEPQEYGGVLGAEDVSDGGSGHGGH